MSKIKAYKVWFLKFISVLELDKSTIFRIKKKTRKKFKKSVDKE